MQQESAEMCSFSARVKKLRVKCQFTWVELAGKLLLSESMLYQVASGGRSLGENSVYRLEELERNAGIEVSVISESPALRDAPGGHHSFAAEMTELMELADACSDQLALLKKRISSLDQRLKTMQR